MAEAVQQLPAMIDSQLEQIYATRFGPRSEDREVLWRTLVRSYFQRFVGPSDTVLDMAAGYCEFINNVECAAKIAVDLNPTVKMQAADGVRVCTCQSTDLPADLSGQVDVVWISNFLEHLADSAEMAATLAEAHRVLRPGGRLLVLQPNIRLTKEAYWDFFDHSLPITERSLAEALRLTGFEIESMKVRFLPYTTESRLPVQPWLIRLYLRLPIAQRLLGKQTFVVARRPG
jgi:SAM-dependent methyltransferase